MEYTKQILLGGLIAFVLAVSLGAGVLALPLQSATLSTTTTGSSSLSTTVASSTTSSSSSSVSTETTITFSSTTISSTIVTQSPVSLNQALQVSPAASVLLVPNATEASAARIASRLASGLGETITGQANITQGGSTLYYAFKTNNGSAITVSLQAESPYFLQVSYHSKYWPLMSNSTTINPSFSARAADQTASDVLQALGIPGQNISFANQFSYLTPSRYVIQRAQSYNGIPFSGTLTKNPDGTYYFSSSQLFFDFDPSNGSVREAIIVDPYWYIIQQNFPQKIQPTQAIAIGEDYVVHSLGVNQITDSDVQFAVIQNHMYYAVSLTTNNVRYTVFVDPDNGEIGFPQ